MAIRSDEPKVQALAWLVSQLRWEQTLGELRSAGRSGRLGVSRRAAA